MKCHLTLVLSIVFAALCTFHSPGQVVTTIGGNGLVDTAIDGGLATNTSINQSGGIALDAAGNVYFCDQNNNRVRKIDAVTRIISTVAGNGDTTYSDNIPATAAGLYLNWGIAFDLAGNMYITDQLHYRVRKVNTSGIITTFAGTGVHGYSGDGGQATNATFQLPMGIATDNLGNVYVADQASYNVRKITPAGIITTYAGRGTTEGYSGDGGPATDAKLSYLWGLSTDQSGNLYICDGGSIGYRGNSCIRKVNAAGIITTIAGTGSFGYSGDNGPATLATLNQPSGISVDNDNNVYICDTRNNRIRKVDPSGIISTIAGTGVPTFNGEGLAATVATLNQPISVVCGDSGKLFIVDYGNFRIREYHKVLYFSRGRNQSYHICQDLSTQIDSFLAIRDLTSGKTDNWSIRSTPAHGGYSVTYSTSSTGGLIVPAGMFYTPDVGYVGMDSMTVMVSNGVDSNLTSIYFNMDRRMDFAGAISGPSSLCVAETVLLTADSSGGVWTTNNLNAVVRGGLVTGQSAGNVTVTYTITNSCGTVFSKKDLLVYSLPNAGKINGDSLYCIGDVTFLTETIVGGVWSAKNNVVDITANGGVLANRPGLDTIFYTVDDGTCTNRANYTVSVNPYPTSQIALAQDTVCVGEETVAEGIPDGGLWRFSNGNAVLNNGFIKGVAAGRDTISYSYDNTCGVAVDSVILTVAPTPSIPTITLHNNILSIPAGYSSYKWLLNGVSIPGGVNDTFIVQTEGDYSVAVENQYGCIATSAAVHCSSCSATEIEVYPIPSKSLLYVKWCNNLIAKILCVDGKYSDVNIDKGTIDISDFAAGVYMLNLFDTDGVKVKSMRIIKMNN